MRHVKKAPARGTGMTRTRRASSNPVRRAPSSPAGRASSSPARRASSSSTGRMSSSIARRASSPAKWSADVMKHSDAMTLESGVFKLRSARAIAESVMHSSESSHRRKSSPFRSAMSMLNFEINRAGTNLTDQRRRVLERAKDELRKLYGRPASKPALAKATGSSKTKKA